MTLSRKMQEIIDAINADRQGLFAAVTGLSDGQAAYKAAENQWSVADVLHHLALVEEANQKLFGMMLKKAEAGEAPLDETPDDSVVNLINPFRDALIDRERKVTAPERVSPLLPLPLDQGIARLKAARESTTAMAEKLCRYDLSQLKWPHPLFGAWNLYLWFLFVGLHERRHTEQINVIKASPGFPQ
jgi:hypothetical protein